MRKFLFALCLVLMAGIVGYYQFRPDPSPMVDSIAVTNGALHSSLELTGIVINDKTVTITALLNGEIIAIHAREGTLVESQQVLAELDNREASALYSKATADLDYQNIHLRIANANYKRFLDLSRKGNSSKQVVDDAFLEKRRLESAVKVAEAELAIRKLHIENAKVRAPFNGTVLEQPVETGQWVEAGTKLFKLVATTGNLIEVQIDADDASRVSIGQSVRVSSPAWPDRQWQSTLSWLAPSISPGKNSNTFSARLAIGNDAPALLLDQQVDVEIITDERTEILVIPQLALREKSKDNYSVMLIKDDTLVHQPIKTGLFSLEQVEVIEGLRAGDEILLGSTSLEHKTRVQTKSDSL